MTGPYVVRHLEPTRVDASLCCAACGETAWLTAGAYGIKHADACPRRGWALTDAVEYDDGTIAKRSNWPNGEERSPGARVVSVKAFETPTRLRRALAGEDYLDLEGLAGMPDATRADIEAAQAQLEALIRDGKVELPDGSTITVEARTWRALCDATGLPYPRSDEDRARILAAWNAEHAIGGERR